MNDSDRSFSSKTSYTSDIASDGSAAWTGPAILLVDLDAFFASVEQLDHPAWRGKPVIVGGNAKGGVVATCSYEARKFGVRSAQASAIAQQLCPEAIWTHGHYDRYREMSNKIMDILRGETPFVQQVSIDEAFVDVTPTRTNKEHPQDIAKRIQSKVEELGVTCSIGIGSSKAVAKTASDMDKPRGLTIVYPGSEQSFLAPLPIRVMSGIGPVAEKVLSSAGVKTLGQMAQADKWVLEKAFGNNAETMRLRALGLQDSEVETEDIVKSVSKETTFPDALNDRKNIEAALSTLADHVGRRLRRKGLAGRTLTLKIRYDDRESHTSQIQLESASDDGILFSAHLHRMLNDVWKEGIKVRLLGVGVSNFANDEAHQVALFEEGASNENVLIHDKDKRRSLLTATDALKEKFGESSVLFGHELRNSGNTTGTSSKNPADYK